MYQSIIKSQDEALCHLFLHCCMRDGTLKETELDLAADRIVRLNIHRNVDVKVETRRYVEYLSSISDQSAYIHYLISIISPVNTLAIYSYCVELILGDGQIQVGEDRLLSLIAEHLHVNAEEQAAIQKMIIQRSVIETDKIF